MRTKGSKNKTTKGISRVKVSISLQPEEYEKLKMLAKEQDKSVSQYIRDSLLK